jgi:hypothetical protein
MTKYNIMWLIKSRRMRCERLGARMGETKGAYRVLVRRSEGK